MKRHLLSIGLVSLLLIFPLISCSSSLEEADVIILAGQSNMVGCSQAIHGNETGALTSEEYQTFLTGDDETKISYECWTKNGENDYALQNSSNDKFIKTLLGEGNTDLTFGPEIGIAKTLKEKGHSKKVFIIKYACGASSLTLDWASTSSGASSYFYPGLLSYVNNQFEVLKGLGYKGSIKAFCWMQGEADAFSSLVGQYYQQLVYFVKDLRKDLLSLADNKEFAFIDGGISDSDTWPEYLGINKSKSQFATISDNNVYIDTIANGLDKNTLQADKAHYLASYMVKLGSLFGSEISNFLSTK